MSSVPATPKVIAIFVADMHLSHTSPPCRAGQLDWYAAMARPLQILCGLQKQHKALVICAGDVFDKWDSPPELISFAMDHLPEDFWAIPGQHDLPHHRYEDMNRSAYGVLVKAGRIKNLSPGKWAISTEKLAVTAFPWGTEIVPSHTYKDNAVHVAVCHKYIWTDEHRYKGAPESSHLRSVWEQFRGYDLAFTGDNHNQFVRTGNPTVVNCGGMMIRRSDDVHTPRAWLLHDDKTITHHNLTTEHDVISPTTEVAKNEYEQDMHSLMEELREIEKVAGLDYAEAVVKYLADNEISPSARHILLGILNAFGTT